MASSFPTGTRIGPSSVTSFKTSVLINRFKSAELFLRRSAMVGPIFPSLPLQRQRWDNYHFSLLIVNRVFSLSQKVSNVLYSGIIDSTNNLLVTGLLLISDCSSFEQRKILIYCSSRISPVPSHFSHPSSAALLQPVEID